MKTKDLYSKYRIRELRSQFFRTPKAIVGVDNTPKTCPKCGEVLETSYSLIPIDKEKGIEVPGAECRRCDKLYIRRNADITEVLTDNLFAQNFTLDGEELWDYTNKARIQEETARIHRCKHDWHKRLSVIPSAEVMICVHFNYGAYSEYIIASNANDCDDKNVFHYSSDLGRELLSAAYSKHRERNGLLGKKSFRVFDCIYPSLKQDKMPEQILPESLNIRSGGGYYSSVKNSRNEIVDVLLYSYRTDKYELIRATYDKDKNKCFTDIALFREYVSKYGRSCLSPKFECKVSGGAKNFDELNATSILKEYGYSVSKKDGLATHERQELLAEIVDLEILSVERVVQLLVFFIRTHPNDSYWGNRIKWEMDKKYIQEYMVNPQRFLIAQD